MKRILTILLSLAMIGTYAQDLSVMTYNIKLDYPKEGENSWTNRKPMFIGQIKFYEPDILGVQEAMPNQMKEMDSVLTDYSFVGVGRDDGKDEGEYSAIFYKKDKFNIIKDSTFWLSETPGIVTKGWDAALKRICTYAKFEDRSNNTVFYVFNTHFDHVGVEARKNSARLIIEKIQEINKENLPVILCGDFNLEEDSEGIKYIKTKLKDSKDISEAVPFGPEGTFNGFEFNEPVDRRIDYIFVNENISVLKYAVLSDSKDLKYPSDHLPVLVKLKLKN